MVEANGLRFEVLVMESAAGAGLRESANGQAAEPPLAMCLHGFPEVAESWLGQMELLASMGYRVWAPNQRGYGRSSRPERMQDYAIEHLMADVAALMDAALAEVPEERRRVVLLGHDWGAVVAWIFATRQVRRLKQMVIVNVPHPACYVWSLRHSMQIVLSWYTLFFQIPRLPEWLLARRGALPVWKSMVRTSKRPERMPTELLDATQQNAAEPGALKAMIDWYRAFVRGGGLRRQMRLGFPVIEVPTLVLWGEADAFLLKKTTEGTGRYVRSLRMRFLPGVSHWVQQDAPEVCAAELREFLQV